MKSLIVFTLFLALALAGKEPENKEIAEVRDAIKEFPGTTLIVLYDAGADQSKTDEMVKVVQDSILSEKGGDKYQFFKTEVPVDALKTDEEKPKSDPERFIAELSIEAISLKHAPTLIATRKGWAFWAHGDGAEDSVKKEIKSFDAKARASNPHALKAKDEDKRRR